MISFNLTKLVGKKETSRIIHDVVQSIGVPVGIYNTEGKLLFGVDLEQDEESAAQLPIKIGDEIVGWVSGGEKANGVATLLSFMSAKEIERKQLAEEILNKYKEINLFYQLSEKITASLELPVVCNLIIEEARRLIATTSGSVMLLNKETGMLEIVAAFGQATHTNLVLKPGEGIAGSVFATGRGEIVNNVSSDPRFVAGANTVSSLICAPLKTRNSAIGVVNFSQSEPIDYTAEDLQLLATLAAQAAQAIENAVLHESQLKDAVARNEIEKGQKMQKDFLPSEILQPDGWELAALFKPARQVAGDFYDTFLLPSGGVGLVIADVCDKGVGSALFMALFRSLIRVFSSETDLLGSVALAPIETSNSTAQQPLTINLDHVNALRAVRLTNNYVAENHSNLNMFATLFFGILEPTTGILTYVNGGHEPLAILNATGIRARLKPTGPAVGMLPNMKFRVQQICLHPGDILIGYTDGVTEAKSPESKFFTEHRLIELLANPPDSANALLERIEAHVTKHIDTADQFDDITMLAVRRLPK
jgi:sigma-B regulation protein RsbU (phosphoserine phosphatase)